MRSSSAPSWSVPTVPNATPTRINRFDWYFSYVSSCFRIKTRWYKWIVKVKNAPPFYGTRIFLFHFILLQGGCNLDLVFVCVFMKYPGAEGSPVRMVVAVPNGVMGKQIRREKLKLLICRKRFSTRVCLARGFCLGDHHYDGLWQCLLRCQQSIRFALRMDGNSER